MAARAWAFLLLLALPDEPDRILSDGSVRGFYGEAFALADVNGDGFRDLIVGAPGWPDSSSEIGRAYLHLGGPAGPSATPVWTSSGDAAPQSFFGRQVVAAGDVNGDGFGDVLVGAQAGAFDKVFLFFGHSGGLSAAAGWTLVPGHHVSFDWAGDVNGDGFGDVVLGWMDGAGVGVAALYTGNPGGMSEGAVWQVEGYEGPVAGASDVNRDGFSDVLVARNNDVAVFHGSATGLSREPSAILAGDDPVDPLGGFDEDFGWTMADAGDVNGDGFPDVVVGAPGIGTGNPFNHGAVYLFLGSPSGLATPYAWKFSGAARGHYVGTAVAAAGDVNGDGRADVVVGATNPLVPRNGTAHLFHGASGGLSASPVWSVSGSEGTERLGTAVGGAPLNGDALSDVVLGSPFAATGDDPGRVLIFHARPDAPPPPPPPTVDPPVDLAQASHPGGDARPVGFTDDDPAMAFRGVVAVGDDGGWLEVEVKPAGTAFDGTGVRMGNAVSTSAGLSEVTFTDLADGSYHWRARTAQAGGGRSAWVEFDPDPRPDFAVDTSGGTPPTTDPPPPPPSPPAPADPAGGGGTNQQVIIDDDDDDCGALGAEVLLLLLALRRTARRRR